MSLALQKHFKTKLFKDLKQGKTHLRQSLLQKTQIMDLASIYKDKKELYKIQDKPIDVDTKKSQTNPEENSQIFVSPEKRLQMYKKEKDNRKKEQKQRRQFKPMAATKIKMRPPIIQRMLSQFQNKYRKQDSSHLLDGLKQSQNNLENIRVNSRKKPLDSKNNKTSSSGSRISRRKMISLQTGLPQDPKQNYPSISQVLKGRYVNTEIKKYVFDIYKFENQLDRYISERFDSYGGGSRNKNHTSFYNTNMSSTNHHKDHIQSRQQHQQGNNSQQGYFSQHNIFNTSVTNNFNKDSNNMTNNHSYSNGKVTINLNQTVRKNRKSANRSFTKTEKSSRNIVNTMSQFHQSKRSKKIQYDQMLQILKHDRPISTKIRRKNYSIIGGHAQDIQIYRTKAQNQRKTIIKKNHQFYMSLVSLLQHQNQNEIKTSIAICEQIKQVFSSEYQLDVFTFHDILSKFDSEKDYDKMTIQIISKIEDFLKIK